MKRLLFIIVGLLLFGNSFAQKSDSLDKEKPQMYPFWMLYTPGATHFADGDIATGLAFTTLEIGAITTGIVYDKALKEHSNSPYYNYPLYMGINAMGVDKCDIFKRNLEIVKYHKSDFKYDEMSFNHLMIAPFKPKNIFAPITGTLVAVAILELWLESRNSTYNIGHVDQFSFLNTYMTRNPALGIYGASSMIMSWEAGVAEEYIFRNYLMPIYDYRWGQKKGLLLSSGVFGAMHAFNYLFVDAPDPLTILYHVGFTTFFGYILGKSVQLNDYKIGRAVAAHTWYDFTLMMGSFLVNPEENIFGVNVRFKF